jgi:hypothetical protein
MMFRVLAAPSANAGWAGTALAKSAHAVRATPKFLIVIASPSYPPSEGA